MLLPASPVSLFVFNDGLAISLCQASCCVSRQVVGDTDGARHHPVVVGPYIIAILGLYTVHIYFACSRALSGLWSGSRKFSLDSVLWIFQLFVTFFFESVPLFVWSAS